MHEPYTLARILADDDLNALCLVPGVGKKTAARLLVELKARLSIPDLGEPIPTSVGATDIGPARADVREALAGLGYTVEEIRVGDRGAARRRRRGAAAARRPRSAWR